MSLGAGRMALAAFQRLRRGAEGTPWGPALMWAQCCPPRLRTGGRGGAEAWLTLGLDATLPARHWPRVLRLHPGHDAVPVRCVEAAGPGRAHAWLRANNADNPIGPGTLAAFGRGREPGGPALAFTAGHVVGGTGLANRFDRISFSVGAQVLAEGRLQGWAPAFDGSGLDTSIDAAAVRLDETAAARLQASSVLPLGWADATAGQPLRVLTRDTQVRGHAVGLLSTFMRLGDDDALSYRLVDGLCYQLDGGSRPGDSGAAVWDAADRLVAIHAGAAPEGAAGNAIASPIRRVLNWFGADLVTRGAPAGPAPPPPAGPALQVLPPPGAVPGPAGTVVREPAHATDVLARTMWGEARGEGEAGMAAVAHVVLNRRDAQRWWGATVEAVCLKPFQFSCWNEGDANRGQLLAVVATDAAFAVALRVAGQLIALTPAERARQDPTNHATHYHARGLAPLPNWARGKQPCQHIGRHVFYRGIA